MNADLECDIAIIGAGSGGLTLAAGASQLGAKVVLIEANKMGGDCLNYGCVPSKSLLAAAKSAHESKAGHFWGVNAEFIRIDFSKVMEHVHNVIAKLHFHDSVERFEELGVQVIQAKAQFINRHTLHAGDHLIKAKRFIIATGSKPFIPPIPGLDKVRYLTNETIFNLKQLPEYLIVIGGGPIGCELAQAFAFLGSHVTLIEAATLLPKDEPDCVEVIRQSLINDQVKIYERSEIYKIENGGENEIKVWLYQEGKTAEVIGTHILVATGRRPVVHDLGLDVAEVKYSEHGINVNSKLRTSNKKVYALGDVVGSCQFTHAASYQAGIVLRNLLFKLPAKVNYDALPWVTYTWPELAHVGLTEFAAKKESQIKISEWPFSEVDRANTDNMTSGKIKIITDKSGKILGVTIVGAHAGELILPWVMAVREKKSLRAFTDVIVPYPTLSEISKRAAGAFYQPKLFSKSVKWLVKLLLYFTRA